MFVVFPKICAHKEFGKRGKDGIGRKGDARLATLQGQGRRTDKGVGRREGGCDTDDCEEFPFPRTCVPDEHAPVSRRRLPAPTARSTRAVWTLRRPPTAAPIRVARLLLKPALGSTGLHPPRSRKNSKTTFISHHFQAAGQKQWPRRWARRWNLRRGRLQTSSRLLPEDAARKAHGTHRGAQWVQESAPEPLRHTVNTFPREPGAAVPDGPRACAAQDLHRHAGECPARTRCRAPTRFLAPHRGDGHLF